MKWIPTGLIISIFSFHLHGIFHHDLFERHCKAKFNQDKEAYFLFHKIPSPNKVNLGAKVMVFGEFKEKEAKEIAKKLTKRYISITKDYPDLKEQYPKGASAKNLDFTIAFWTRDYERPAPEYVSQIDILDGEMKISYKEKTSEKLSPEVKKELLVMDLNE